NETMKFISFKIDRIKPEIRNVVVKMGEYVNITCIVKDNIKVANVSIYITYPDKSIHNFSMINIGGGEYYCNKSFLMHGIYNFSIYAFDVGGNKNTSSVHSFEIFKNSPPAKPSLPNPQNGETNVAINTNLSVYVYDSDNETMDVYFYWNNGSLIGVVNNVANGSIAIIDSLSLQYGKTYYWYAIANDSIYENKSNVWHFKTKINHPPGKPINPNPQNGSIDVALNATLSWQCNEPDGDAVTYDVYFGTSSNPPLVSHNQSSPLYIPSLQHGTTYYWRVVAWDEHGAKNSSYIWHFTTQQAYNSPPICSLQANPESGDAPLTVTFSMMASDVDGKISSWKLDINNDGISEYSGNGSPLQSIQHVYNNAGSYIAKLTVIDDGGAKAYAYATIVVNTFNNLVASFSYSPLHPHAGDEIQFFDKSIGNIVNWTWQFGDGNLSYEKNPKHGYSMAGNYTVILQIFDGREHKIEKKNLYVAPEASLNFSFYPGCPAPGMNVSFFGFADFFVSSWTWNFGDGSVGYGSNVSHAYNSAGEYNVTLVAGSRKIVKEIHVMFVDLAVKKIEKIVRGKNAIIEAFIENNGGSVSNVEVCFYKNGKIFYDDILDIDYGEEKQIEKEINLSKGKNEIKVFVDPEKKIEEENREDNFASVYIYYKGASKNISFLWYLIPAILAIFVLYALKRKKRIPVKTEHSSERCAVCFGKFKPDAEIVRCKCGAAFHKSCAERVKICPNCGRKLKI
ncbi:MAG: PKD domain-containing protein, partial [Thermoplasmata archaeon]|nr:PKD domain-containing protein [Thermoplasmata archaeon]